MPFRAPASPRQPPRGRRHGRLHRASRAALGLVLATAVGLLGCSPEPGGHYGTTERRADPHTFYLNNNDEPEYIDPGLSSDSTSNTLVADLFEGLVVKHPEDLRPTQGVAKAWDKSDDNTLYRFHLRKEARWSDGKPVVAGDFVYAWRRVLTAKTGARMATLLYPIKNAAGFHRGKLKALARATSTRSKPSAAAPAVAALSEGAMVRLVALPRAEVGLDAALTKPVKGGVFTWKAGTLTHAGASQAAGAPKKATVLGAVADATCNGKPDHLYRVKAGKTRGYLPGCALGEGGTWAEVEPKDDRPTFKPAPTPPEKAGEGAKDPRRGFVPLTALVDDPTLIGLRAVGDHVLEVQLAEPTPYFLELCASPTYSPVRRDLIEHWEAAGRPDLWYRPENIITNGPYTLESWKFRYEITFKRNPHHYDHDKLKIHRVVWLEVPDYHQTLNLYQAGDIDYIGANVSLPNAYMRHLAKFKDFSRSLYLSTYWYEFNVDKKPVDDVRVRRALNLGVNKQLLVDQVTRAGQMPATHYVPPYTGSGYAAQHARDAKAGRDPFHGKGHDFDPEEGRRLLAEAGYPVKKEGDSYRAEGFPPLEILYNTSEGHRSIAVALQDMWKRHLGVTVGLRNEEWKVMIKNLRDGHYQVARFGWVADYNHPATWMDVFLSYSDNNWTHWKDPKFDALVARAARTRDPAKSIQLYRDAERLAVTAMPRLPLYFYTKSTLIKPWVKGFWDNATNDHFVRWMWIDENWRNDAKNRPSYAPRELPAPGRFE